MSSLEDRLKGCLFGLACGDAVGTTVEFKRRGTFEPMTDMVGGGPFNLEKGQWTDDTSMALCLAQSLVEKNSFDAQDQIEKYCQWANSGYMSSNGKCFDIGNTVRSALTKFKETGEPFSGATDKYSSGNGSIMRLAPIPIFYHSDYGKAIHFAGESSRTTHGSLLCIESCRLMCDLILNAFVAEDKDEILKNTSYEPTTKEVMALKHGEFSSKSYEDMTGSGYVIDSLETALWCFFNSKSFKEAILLSVNVGNDADTTAAVCGQIAGAFYGLEGIPKDWRESITMKSEIESLLDELGNLN